MDVKYNHNAQKEKVIAQEANFDGLIGPTHNYAGLSTGNMASTLHSQEVARPKEAALQGLKKMLGLSQMGLVQGVLAPNCRPDLGALRRLGFCGEDKAVIAKAFKKFPEILASCYSASSMWTANAATVSPSADTDDGKVHFTPANLSNQFHRSLEPLATAKILQQTFNNDDYFKHHQCLPTGEHFGDEGAANHTRFCSDFNDKGVEFFVFGRYSLRRGMPCPKKYPARQTAEASMAIARLHGLSSSHTVFAQQNPQAIDAGVFHNDVISVGNGNVYFYHQDALIETEKTLKELREKFSGEKKFYCIEVPRERVSVADSVESYLFNSQLVALPDGNMALVAPRECQHNKRVKSYLDDLVLMGTPITQVKTFDVKQSMQNGGGPACLRLRVVLTPGQQRGLNQNTLITEENYRTLCAWVNKHYREELRPGDLADPNLLTESYTALDELTQILGLGEVYPFQI